MITAMNSFFFDEDRSFNFVVLIIGDRSEDCDEWRVWERWRKEIYLCPRIINIYKEILRRLKISVIYI